MPPSKLLALERVPVTTSEYVDVICRTLTDPLKSIVRFFTFEDAYDSNELPEATKTCEK